LCHSPGRRTGHPDRDSGCRSRASARILYSGSTTNVFEVRASHVTIRGLEFGPTHPDADAIRIFNGNGVTIEDCHFNHLGALAVVANHASVRGLVVRRNVIRNSLATALYFGCHDGNGCSLTGS